MSWVDDAEHDIDADELADLAALERQRRKDRGAEAAPATTEWTPQGALAAALWAALPPDGRGVEYWRVMHRVAGERWPVAYAQAAMVGLVLLGHAYCEPGAQGGVSMVGRGVDPRVGAAAYRTGAVEF